MGGLPKAVAVAVVIDRGRVLVGRRPATAVAAAGFSEFPGGKLEPGETAATAARRECREETGLEIVVGRRLATASIAETGGLISFFSGRLEADSGGRPRPPFAWLTAAELAACHFPPANAAVLSWLAAELASRPPSGCLPTPGVQRPRCGLPADVSSRLPADGR